MGRKIETLLSAAILAPSGDNTQPWRFAVDADAETITFFVDESRDPSPMNAGQVMSQIAVGAAVENALRTAHHNGWSADLEETEPPALARIRVRGGEERQPSIEDAITERVTNRRVYERRPLPAEDLARLLRDTPVLDGVTTHWVIDANRLAELANLIGRADAVMFSNPSVRRAFLANIRFDKAADDRVEHGLSLGSLEPSALDRLALRMMHRIPNWLMKIGAGGMFESRARKLVESSSGLCLIVAPDRLGPTPLRVGRAAQRAWLALTAAGLAAQPMMSLLVLENLLAGGPPELIASLGRERLATLGSDFRRLAPEIGGGQPAFLMRFGFALAPSGRTGRLPWKASLLSSGTMYGPRLNETAPATDGGDESSPR
jgi:nitroreductase